MAVQYGDKEFMELVRKITKVTNSSSNNNKRALTDAKGEENLISVVVTLYYLKCPVFNNNFKNIFKETGNYGPYIGKIQS